MRWDAIHAYIALGCICTHSICVEQGACRGVYFQGCLPEGGHIYLVRYGGTRNLPLPCCLDRTIVSCVWGICLGAFSYTRIGPLKLQGNFLYINTLEFCIFRAQHTVPQYFCS